MESDGIFNNLRKKLDVLGYQQPLPGIALVGALLQDLITTTESLRDSKLKINNLLEEKSCWKLGVEPYKCDNARLLAETNDLSIQLIKQKEYFEEQICEFANKIRNLESDKRFLENHCKELETQIKHLAVKYSDTKLLKTKSNAVTMNKKPAFVTTVKSGGYFRNTNDDKCVKCNGNIWVKPPNNPSGDGYSVFPNPYEYEKIQNALRENADQLAVSKRKIEARDREISRLNELLAGGRGAAALAKDCCYKNVGTLSEDLEILQREKSENLQQLQETQESMHEAKQRAIDLSERNKRLEKELDDLKKTALYVENEANEEIVDKEKEIEDLRDELQQYKIKLENYEEKYDDRHNTTKINFDDKRKLQERLNQLTMREQELNSELERMQKKNQKLKLKLSVVQKESEDRIQKDDKFNDEAILRLKTERDFFQKEYLNLMHKAGSDKEISYLQSQIKNKDDELCNLRSELQQTRNTIHTSHMEKYGKPSTPMSSSSSSVQAAILRVEREKDLIKSDLERIKMERDTLRDRLKCSTQVQYKESHEFQEKIEQLKIQIDKLEKDKRELESSHIPNQTHIVLMKEEIDELKKRIYQLQEENCKLNTTYNQIKILQEQTERALFESQNKNTITETQLENAETRLNFFGTNRESSRTETGILRNEIIALKSINQTVESEKEKIMSELDSKTEKLYKLESDLKTLTRKNKELQETSQEFLEKYEKLTNERKDRENELHETSFESKTLRSQITTLKASKDQALAENSRLTNDLAESQAEVIGIKIKLQDSEKEVDRLRKQLQQYVSEVKKAEELLLAKEKERDEMLEHYRSLSHDAVMLEGNNQSLEIEAAEHKRQICDAEAEIIILKKELCIRNGIIEKLEKQITCLSSQICSLEKELEQSYDDHRLVKVDLDAMKELCEKLDLQRDKLNDELEELGAIRTKLERENERLRRNSDRSNTGIQASTDTLEKLLDKARYDLDDSRKLEKKLTNEVEKLKEKTVDLEIKFNREQEKCIQKENLAKEYNVQLQELRHTLTDDRFKAAQIREQSPRHYPTL